MQVPAPLGAFPVSYKYALRDSDGVLHMEHGENRTVSLPEGTPREAPLWLLSSNLVSASSSHVNSVARV